MRVGIGDGGAEARGVTIVGRKGGGGLGVACGTA